MGELVQPLECGLIDGCEEILAQIQILQIGRVFEAVFSNGIDLINGQIETSQVWIMLECRFVDFP